MAVFLFFGFGTIHQRHFQAGTSVSRLDLLHALVEAGSWNIDLYHTNTSDKAIVDGHYYSDKAPGTAGLALPAFAAATAVLKLLGIETESQTGWLATSWVASAFSQALPAALGGALLFLWLGQFVSQRLALLSVLGLFMGSLPLAYATLLFSHAQVIGLIAVAVWALAIFSNMKLGVGGIAPKSRTVLAGFCIGLALASEYTAGLVAVGVVLYLVFCRRNDLLAFVLGAIPPLLLVPAYSWVTLGDPFTLPYNHQASFLAMKEGLYAIKTPDLENLVRLLLSPTRGLVFWTPFLLMAIPGAFRLALSRPRWLWLVYYLPLLHIVVISGRVWDWQAGSSLSARYMAPILPLLALPCALGFERWPKLGGVLVAYSIGIVTFATLTDACPDAHIYNPLLALHMPLFLKGDFSPNLLIVLGASPYVSVAVFYAVIIAGIWWLWRLVPPDRRPTSSSNAPE